MSAGPARNVTGGRPPGVTSRLLRSLRSQEDVPGGLRRAENWRVCVEKKPRITENAEAQNLPGLRSFQTARNFNEMCKMWGLHARASVISAAPVG